tara:strand:- start:514 stop:1164 length:651 start_codon:yes stop_codon:yes gene_type:complete
MQMISDNLKSILSKLPKSVILVAVSKTKPNTAIMEAYDAGHRVFGENKVQDMVAKSEELPSDIQWHMIGHLQTNKVKFIAPFVSLIHGVDSLKLIKEIDKRAAQNNRIIECLLQIRIAEEETKFGLSDSEAFQVLESAKHYKNVRITGLMGMATNTIDKSMLRNEFAYLKALFLKCQSVSQDMQIVSMGMSSDYEIAIEQGSTMVRVGSAIFGQRN